jgi:hypothetical protein
MDSDNRFWLGVWITVGTTLVILIGIMAAYFTNKHEQIKTASTCEAAVLIEGTEVNTRLMICTLGKK